MTKLSTGQSLFGAQDYQGALRAFQQALCSDPHDESAGLWLGDTYQALGKRKEAREQFEILARQRSMNVQPYFRLLSLYIAAGDKGAARRVLQQISALPIEP